MKRALVLRSFQVVSGVILGLVLVFWLLRPAGPDRAPETSYFLPDPIPAPDFRLTSHDGRPVGPRDFPGKTLLVFFGYTSCPDICPLTLSHLTRALRQMGEEAGAFQVLLISVDPARDTPQRLERYLGAFDSSFVGLRGTEEEVRQVAGEFGAFFFRSGEEEGYTVDHTARTFVVDPSGRIPLTSPVTATPEEIARDLDALLENAT